jgi:hypothetical protein
MAIAQKQSSSDDDFLKVGPDATATFDNSPSNPTEYASSENLDEDEVDEDIDEEGDEEEEYDEEDDEEEEYQDDDESDDDEEDDDEDEEEDGEEDHDLATGPKPPSVYRKV